MSDRTSTQPDAATDHVSACILCECNCGIRVQFDGRRFARTSGDPQHPSSAGYTCEKALRLDHYQNGRHRLDTPLRRRPDGTHETIDWDTAICEIAARLQGVVAAHGGESVFSRRTSSTGSSSPSTPPAQSRCWTRWCGCRSTGTPLPVESTSRCCAPHVRGPGRAAGAEQHPGVLPEQAAVDPHWQLRPARDDVPALQDLWLAGHRDRAADRVPIELGRRTNLLGPRDLVRERLQAYRVAGVDVLQAKLSGTLDERLATLSTLLELCRDER